MNFYQPENMKVLLVDDNATNLDVLRNTLSPEGYQLAVARDGKKALDIVTGFQPDLILLDIMMPGMDGYQVCEQLKADEKNVDIPIIFITAKIEPADILKGFAVGCVDYMTKPFNRAEVCARVNTQLRLRASQQQLKELNQQKNHLLGVVAHDLRNPLSGIISYTELMKEGAIPREQHQECLEILHNTGWQMLTLVNDLLDFAAIERGELSLQYQKTSLQALIQQRLNIYQLKAQGRHIHIHTDYQSVPEFYFDPNRLAQVVDNLLGNALKFSPTHSEITVRLWHRENKVHLSIADQGDGLPEDFDLEQLSQKGVRQVASGEKSTGFGLAIVKKILAAHLGQLQAHSQIGKGSVFNIELPLLEQI